MPSSLTKAAASGGSGGSRKSNKGPSSVKSPTTAAGGPKTGNKPPASAKTPPTAANSSANVQTTLSFTGVSRPPPTKDGAPQSPAKKKYRSAVTPDGQNRNKGSEEEPMDIDEADRDDGGDSITETWTNVVKKGSQKRVAFARGTDARRQNSLYITLQTPKPTGQKILEAWQVALVDLYYTIRDVDESFVIYKYDKSNEQESDALLEPERMPKMPSKIVQYFHKFNIKSKGQPWLHVRVGFNESEEVFFKNARELLSLDDIKLSRKRIQVPRSDQIGWFLHSHDRMDGQVLSDYLNKYFIWYAEQLGEHHDPPIQCACSSRMITDGIPADKRPPGYERTRAMHIEFPQSQMETGRRYVRMALTTEGIGHLFNIQLQFIPSVYYESGEQSPEAKAKKQDAILQQRNMAASVGTITTHAFTAIDRPCKELDDITFRRLLLDTQSKDGHHLFFAIDPHWSGTGYFVTYPKLLEKEAKSRLSCIFAYLVREKGTEVYRWATPATKAATEAMGWDEENNRPITAEEKEVSEAVEFSKSQWWMMKAPAYKAPEAADLVRPDKEVPKEVVAEVRTISSFGSKSSIGGTAARAAHRKYNADYHDDDNRTTDSTKTRLTTLEHKQAKNQEKNEQFQSDMLKSLAGIQALLQQPSQPDQAGQTAGDSTANVTDQAGTSEAPAH